MPEPDSEAVADRWQLPRGLIILLALASAVIVVFGMRQVADILGPMFLALVLTITVHPLRTWLSSRGVPRWLATLLVILGIYAILIGIVASLVLGVARLATLLPGYVPEMQETISGLRGWLADLGVGREQIAEMVGSINTGQIVSLVGKLLSGALDVLSALVFVIALVLFMAVDGAAFGSRMDKVGDGRGPAIGALRSYAVGTRKYLAVSTVFGAIVALLDWAALLIIGVPAAFLWGVVAFVTNYIPNVGFLIGLAPPAILAYLTGGMGKMVAVIIVYCALNLVIQSVIQPKIVGDSVGLTTTVSFLSLIVWSYILGPIGSILAVPMTLLAKGLLVDVDPDAKWLQLFLGDEPVYDKKRRYIPRRRGDRAKAVAPQD